MTGRSQSRVAATLLAFLIPREDAEAILGDLEEERRSRSSAFRWYWSQIVRSIPFMLWLTIHRGGWFATCVLAVAACAVQIAIEVATGLAIRRFAPIGVLWPSVVASIVTLTSLGFLSFTASRVRRGAAIVLAALAVCAVALQLAVAAQAGGDPRGGTLAAFIVAPGTALIGGFLSSRVRTP